MKKLLLIISILGPLSIWGQTDASFSVAISNDTVGLNGVVEVTFTLENAPNKQFAPPDFDGFVAQGPSTSMMTSITNGSMKQTASYTFYLTPRAIGSFKIGSVSLNIDGNVLKTEEKTVIVVAHSDAEIRPQQRARSLFDFNENPFFRRSTPPPTPEKSKKKYQSEKI
jgi:hypothetical protein